MLKINAVAGEDDNNYLNMVLKIFHNIHKNFHTSS